MEAIKCIGCGSTLQSESMDKIGYIDKEKFGGDMTTLLCRRCFRLKHYHESPEVNLSSDEFRMILSRISDENALIVNVVDLFDFSGSLIPGLSRFIGSNEMILVGNKRDLLPKAIKPQKIIHWM